MQLLASIADLMDMEQGFELVDCDPWLADVVQPDVPAEVPDFKKKDEVTARVTQLKNHPLLTALTVGDKDAVRFPHPLYRDFFLATKFKSASLADAELRTSLRGELPEGSIPFLAQMFTDTQVASVAQKAFKWNEGVRNVWKIILAKCDLLPRDETHARSERLVGCLGGARAFDYQNLSGLNFRMLELHSFSFIGTDFTKASFHACKFENCHFEGSQLAACRFYECDADEATAKSLDGLGIQADLVSRMFRSPKVTVTSQEEDPVLELITKFFRRFIRDQRGTNQRSARVESFFSGLGGEERKFTDHEIIRVMLSEAVITERETGVRVYVFNTDWQADGDELIFDRRVSDKLKPILERLRERARRYNLL